MRRNFDRVATDYTIFPYLPVEAMVTIPVVET